MMAFFKLALRAMAKKIKNIGRESGCRKCGMCRHVCSLLNNRAAGREE